MNPKSPQTERIADALTSELNTRGEERKVEAEILL